MAFTICHLQCCISSTLPNSKTVSPAQKKTCTHEAPTPPKICDSFCLLSLSTLFLRLIHVVPCISTSFLFDSWVIFHFMNIPQFAYPLTQWWTCELFPHFCYCKECCCEHVHVCIFQYLFSVLLGIFLRMELLGHILIPSLIFWGPSKVFSTVAAIFYIPTSDVQGL